MALALVGARVGVIISSLPCLLDSVTLPQDLWPFSFYISSSVSYSLLQVGILSSLWLERSWALLRLYHNSLLPKRELQNHLEIQILKKSEKMINKTSEWDLCAKGENTDTWQWKQVPVRPHVPCRVSMHSTLRLTHAQSHQGAGLVGEPHLCPILFSPLVFSVSLFALVCWHVAGPGLLSIFYQVQVFSTIW